MLRRPISARCPRAGPGRRAPGHKPHRGRLLRIDLGLGHETATLKRNRALIIRLGQRGIGARGFDLRRKLRGLLRLDRTVDDGQRLPRAHPVAGIDQYADDPAARSGDADRLVALGSEWSAGGNGAPDLARPGTMTVTVGTCPALAAAACCALVLLALRTMITAKKTISSAAATPPMIIHAAALARSIGHHERVRRVDRGFPVHHSLPSFANPWPTGTVLAQ